MYNIIHHGPDGFPVETDSVIIPSGGVMRRRIDEGREEEKGMKSWDSCQCIRGDGERGMEIRGGGGGRLGHYGTRMRRGFIKGLSLRGGGIMRCEQGGKGQEERGFGKMILHWYWGKRGDGRKMDGWMDGRREEVKSMGNRNAKGGGGFLHPVGCYTIRGAWRRRVWEGIEGDREKTQDMNNKQGCKKKMDF